MGWIGALVMAFLAIAGLNFLFSLLSSGAKIGGKIAADAMKEKNRLASEQSENDENNKGK